MPKKRRRQRGRTPRRTHPALARVLRQLRAELARPGDARGRRERLARLSDRLHAARAPEKDKLREKDQLVIDLIARFEDALTRRGAVCEITRVEFLLFQAVADILNAIEDVLWELKGNQGPKPRPSPPPQPD